MAEFYKSFEDSLILILTSLFGSIWKNKNLTATQCMAIIILLFKKGDPRVLGNYQLISLTNANYKILAYLLSDQLSDHLSDVIAVNQMAYMSGHFIGTNIRYIQDTMSYFAEHSADSIILFLDYKKAFNSVSHKFLFYLLEKIGFPAEFIEWVCIMYSSAVSSVRHNNWLTSPIILQQGVRQGCQLSCHLFNLVGQTLIYYIRDKYLFSWWKKRGDPCSLYADDTAIFLEKISDLPLVIDTIFLVGNYTGLCLNLSKTITFALHGGLHKVAGVEVNSALVKYLGVHLGLGDLIDMNFYQALKKAWNNLQSWNKRQISLFAHVLVAKTFVASIFVHTLNLVFVSSHQIHLIQQLLNDCVW